MPVIVQDLRKQFGTITAVDGISFSVEAGEIFGFLGPNGAGKTTTINILCTLLSATSGSAHVAGFDCARQPAGVRANIGLVFQDTTLDLELTAWENLKFHAYLYSLSPDIAGRRIDAMLDLVGLSDRKHDSIKTFSGGMKRRLEIARGLVHQPRVLFLDEPTLGLDPQTRSRIWEFINTVREQEGVTVFMTTHYMDEAENCDRIGIIDHGRIIALDSPERLKGMVRGDIVSLVTADNDKAVEEIGKAFGLSVRGENGTLAIETEKGDEFIPRLLGALSVPVLSVRMMRPSLDDVFLNFTGRTIRDDILTDDAEIMRESARSRRDGR